MCVCVCLWRICERRELLAREKVAAGYRFGVSAYKVLIQYGICFSFRITALTGLRVMCACLCVVLRENYE